jgi:outer membrane lipoprotein-sorting protein
MNKKTIFMVMNMILLKDTEPNAPKGVRAAGRRGGKGVPRRLFLVPALAVLCVLAFSLQAAAQTPSGEEILRRMDENQLAGNKIIHSSMIVHGRRGDRTMTLKSWIEGEEKSFSEYLSPPREAGVKMLKLEDQLWTYYPSTDRTIKIAGHLLRQSMMGSDLSYEDMMEDPELVKLYEAEVIGEETYAERPCWILKLTARERDVAYQSRKVWVDRERFVPLREELFAKSGELLKTLEIKKVSRQEGRWIPMHMVFKDVLKKGKGTEFIIETIEFDADIPEYIFTKAALRR